MEWLRSRWRRRSKRVGVESNVVAADDEGRVGTRSMSLEKKNMVRRMASQVACCQKSAAGCSWHRRRSPTGECADVIASPVIYRLLLLTERSSFFESFHRIIRRDAHVGVADDLEHNSRTQHVDGSAHSLPPLPQGYHPGAMSATAGRPAHSGQRTWYAESELSSLYNSAK